MGNASLKFIPTGGMFVTGGLAPKNINLIRGRDSPFMRAYLDKGRMNPLLDAVPLFAVMSEDIGLRGARVCAERVSVFPSPPRPPRAVPPVSSRARRVLCPPPLQELKALK